MPDCHLSPDDKFKPTYVHKCVYSPSVCTSVVHIDSGVALVNVDLF